MILKESTGLELKLNVSNGSIIHPPLLRPERRSRAVSVNVPVGLPSVSVIPASVLVILSIDGAASSSCNAPSSIDNAQLSSRNAPSSNDNAPSSDDNEAPSIANALLPIGNGALPDDNVPLRFDNLASSSGKMGWLSVKPVLSWVCSGTARGHTGG